MKAKEMMNQSVEELKASVYDARAELFGLANTKRQTKKLDKPHKIQGIKKDIARMLTVINQKRSQEQ